MNGLSFEHLPLAANLALFTAAATIVWIAGTRLAVYADEISDRRRIGKAMMGFVFLAAATELPEMVTTFTAALADEANLVLGNMFGGITMQTAILAVVDLLIVRGALTLYPRKPTPAVEAALIILLLTAVIALGIAGDVPMVWNIGYGTVGLAIAYGFAIRLLRGYEDASDWLPVEVPEEAAVPDARHPLAAALSDMTLSGVIGRFSIASAAILVCGVVLVWTTEAIAVQTGLGTSFLAVTLLAATTSLPELSTTIAAARLGAYTMAISNIFGSNLIMLALLLPADILYRPGPILSTADPTAMLALVSGVLVTAVYLIGLLMRRKWRILGMGIDSMLVLAIYAASLVLFYRMS